MFQGNRVGAIQRALLVLEQQGGDEFLRRTGAEDRRHHAHDARWARRDLRAGRRQADDEPAPLCDLPALAAVGTVRGTAGNRRSGQAASSCSSSTRRICLFDEAPHALLDKVEQVVRLIRSKGVGVYFVTQNPLDIPGNGAGAARQPHPACAARLYAARDRRR